MRSPLRRRVSLGTPFSGMAHPSLQMIGRRRATPSAPITTRRTTMAEFARRGATSARDHGARCLEIATSPDGHGHLFDSARYESVQVREPTLDDAYPGYVPNRPIDLLPPASGRFEVVLCLGVLERLHEPHGFMAELSRTMEAGARLFLTAPLIIPEPTIAIRPGRHRVGLNFLVESAGLQIEDLVPIERSSSYAVVGRRTRRADGQRRDDPAR